MTYLAERPVSTLVNRERTLITIEFAPRIHPKENQHSYKHPRFVFGDRVSIINTYPEIEYTVCALELIESKTPSGRLLAQPRWKYKITNSEVCYWKEESAISRLETTSSNRTCTNCPYFQDYQELKSFEIDGKRIRNNNSGKGWCRCFNIPARSQHKMTDDCKLNGASKLQSTSQTNDESPHLPNFHVGNIVKIIDTAEHHSEWGVFEIVKVLHNEEHFDSVENYFNTSQWHYKLISYQRGDEAIWVGDEDICLANLSHNVCTDNII